uniref:Not1 domain-containing protein n=1 Tax=Rhabditophanes sp. KR3021 TaxID=114890 RepID=A0AC35UCG6_9BILA
MARATASCMMHITTKESLNNGLLNSMKNKCNAVVSNCVPQPELRTPELFKQVEVMVREVYESNIDTITNFVVKITSERAITDIDKRLEADYQARAVAKNENRPYVNAYGLELQERLPEVLRLDDNGISNDKVTQYMAQFDRAYQFKPLLAESEGPRVEPVAIPQVIVEVDKLVRDLGLYIKPITQLLASQVNIPGVTTIKAYHSIAAIKEIFSVFFNTPKTADTVVAMTTQVSDCFMQGYDPDSYGPLGVNRNLSGTGSQLNTRLKEIFLGYFSKLYNHMKPHDVHQLLTKIVMERSVSVRLKEWQSMDVIFKRCMIDSKSHDAMMANAINDGNVQEITYAQKLSKMFGTDSRVFAQYTSLYPLTITALKKYMTKGMVFGEMTKAVEPATTPIPDNFAFSVEQLSAKEKTLIINAKAAYNDNPSQMALKTEVIFREWLRICNLTEYHDDTQGLYQKIVQMLMYEGILISDDTLSDFFICLLDLSVDLSKRLEENLEKIMDPVVLRIRHHRHIDGLVKLVTILIRYSGTNGAASKLKVFMTFCATLTRVFVADYNANEKKFCTIPYHRILTMLFSQLMTNEPTLERYHTTICEAFAQLLFSIQPKLYPRICFVWIEMLGHKNVLHAFLAYGNESPDGMKRWSMYAQLLQVALKFVHPFIRNITMKNSTQHLFSGMVKLLLVILHDFPDLLCEYHFKFVDVIPTNCTQIKNIVLSAYPQAQILPDPFVTSLEQIEVLPDMHTDPKQFLKFEQYLPAGFLKQLDEFLENRSSIEVLSELPSMCKTFPPNHEFPGRYNTQFINALVVYLGKRAVESIKEKKLTITTQTIAHTSYMDVFQHLALSLDSEGRYLLFSALANNLRYPNSQTHYFCKAILFLFKEVGQQAVQEQLTRTLFERIICLRPHPWGLLVTFIELIRNTEYRFWEYDFVNCAPELKRLLRCVSNSTQIKGGSISVDVGSTTPSSNSVDKNSPAEGLVYN